MKDLIFVSILCVLLIISVCWLYSYANSPEWSNAEKLMSRSDALVYCHKLRKHGHTDWRLPKTHELSEKGLNGYWASDSDDTQDSTQMRVVCARNLPEKAEPAKKGPEPTVQPKSEETPGNKGTVKSEEKAKEQPKKEQPKKEQPKKKQPKTTEECIKPFTDSGLTWCHASKARLSWEQANRYCRNIQYDGKTGWHLPDSDDFKAVNFSDEEPQRFWRSGEKEYYWDRLEPNQNRHVNTADTICVRKN